mgnify:CR=1 FL=1|tara:strand:+ start:57 stop:797 length:741 start_codon:yes stop_codon:yes gene_type:complete
MRRNYHIENILVDINRLEMLEKQATFDFKNLVSKFGNDFVLGFSGGKDSVVVSHFASQFGINKGSCEYSFCFPKDKTEMKLIAKQMGLEIEFMDSLSDEWLLDNKKYIFPKGKDSSVFYLKRQQKSIKNFAKGHTGLITGRRHEENQIKDMLYKTVDGMYHFHPLANWNSKDIWGYIKWKKIPYLSIYDNELGQMEGATCWCNISRRKTPNEMDCWRLIYNYDNEYFKNHLMKHYTNARIFYEQFI